MFRILRQLIKWYKLSIQLNMKQVGHKNLIGTSNQMYMVVTVFFFHHKDKGYIIYQLWKLDMGIA